MSDDDDPIVDLDGSLLQPLVVEIDRHELAVRLFEAMHELSAAGMTLDERIARVKSPPASDEMWEAYLRMASAAWEYYAEQMKNAKRSNVQ